MLIEQNIEFELGGPGSPGRTCSPITGQLHDKTKISEKNFRVDHYLLLKYCSRQYSLLPQSGPNKPFTIKIQRQIARFLTCLDLNCK